jgi:hypothetical protein
MLTKKQALRIFKETLLYTKVNIHQLRQAWVYYTDSLHRDKRITDSQVKRWTNPFKHPIK